MNTKIIFISRFLIFSFIGLISSINRKIFFSLYHKYNHFISRKKSIAVCGRGKSANKYFKEEFKKHTKLFLVNYLMEDLNCQDYLKLVNKELVIITNIVEDFPNFLFLSFIKIKEIIIALPNDLINKNIFQSNRSSYKLNCMGVKVRGIRESLSLDIFAKNREVGGIGTGILAIFEAAEFAKHNNVEKVFLYGFDFYSGSENKNSPLRNSYNTLEEYLEHRSDNLKLSESLDFLVSKYPKITFVNNTINDFKFMSKNIQTIKYF